MKKLSAAAALVLAASAFGQGTLIMLDSDRQFFAVDLETGAQTLLGQTTAGSTAAGLAYSCSNHTLYMTSTGDDTLYTIDLNAMVATPVGPYGDATLVMHGLEWDGSTNTLYGGSNGNLYTIDAATGFATLVGPSGTTSFFNLGWHSGTNTLYATSSNTDSLYTVDRATGAATLVGPLNGPTNPHGMAYVPHLNQMFVVCSSTDTIYTVDVTTGAATPFATPLGATNPLGLVWVPDFCVQPNIDVGMNLSASTPCQVQPGGQETFTAQVKNNGLTPVTNATVTFTMPAGSSFVSSIPAATPVGNTLTVNLGNLAPAATAQLSVTVTLGIGQNVAQASVAITEADEYAPNNSRSRASGVGPATANARAILSNVSSQANSEVPGMPGQRFTTTGFDRPFRSPNGGWFVLTADTDAATTADEVLLVVDPSGEITLGAREGDIGPDGAAWGPFDPVYGINDSGHFVMSNNTLGGTTVDEVIVKWNGTAFENVIVEGGTIPNNATLRWGTTNSSATIQNDGTVSFTTNFTSTPAPPTTSDTGVFRNNGNNFTAREGVTVPTGQISNPPFSIKLFDTGATDGQGFYVSGDGAHYLWTGTVNDATAFDNVVVVDNGVVLQQGATITGSGFSSPVSVVNYSYMEGNGDWLSYGSNDDGLDWAVRNGVVIAKRGDSIDPLGSNSPETWSDVPYAQGFFFALGGPTGSYAVGGTTSSANGLTNAVVVLNGATVIARENDPVDLNNDGIFNDQVYIRTFLDDSAFLTSTDLYVLVTLRDAATALGCSFADGDMGQALVKIPLPGGNPCPGNQCGPQDYNGDGDSGTDQDIEAFFACLGGTCCPTCFCQGSDFNGDGDFGTDQDIEAFFRVLGGNPC